MRISDDRYERDRRKYHLAQWMVQHGARTRTITQWTGLTQYRVRTLVRAYEHTRHSKRHRGASPFQPAYFFKSLALECETAVLGYIAYQTKTIPEGASEGARLLPGLERGERLMSAFEVYQALVPNARISLEHAILLVRALFEHQVLSLRHCDSCEGLIVFDRLGSQQVRCPFCRLAGSHPENLAASDDAAHVG
jgi:hypothetical protein